MRGLLAAGDAHRPALDPRQRRAHADPLGRGRGRTLGYPPETALTLDRLVAGSSTRAKA
jgi:hypothetical protein